MQLSSWLYAARIRHRNAFSTDKPIGKELLLENPETLSVADQWDLEKGKDCGLFLHTSKVMRSSDPESVRGKEEDLIVLNQIEQPYVSSEEEMLFSQPTTKMSSPFIASLPFEDPSRFSVAPRKRQLPIHDTNFTQPKITDTTVCNMTSTALHLLISGSTIRSQLNDANIAIGSPHPSITLSVLAPSIFCPGFKQLVAHNAKFLPTISNAVCSAWVRNAQGPGLREKLVALSVSTVSELGEGDSEAVDERSAERLSGVFQARVWAMMQTGLLDARSARGLKWEPSNKIRNNGGADDCQEEDLLQGHCGVTDAERGHSEVKLSDLLEDEFMDYEEELLFKNLSHGDAVEEDMEELLQHFEEEERRQVEMDTDEMLFGNEAGWEDDELLLGHDIAEIEHMLL